MHRYPTRSAIPRVVGILMIVFCGFGLFGSAIWTYGPIYDIHLWDGGHAWRAVEIWLYVWCILGLAVFGVHLAGGIIAVMYRPSAPRWVSIYAISAIVLGVADVVIVTVLAPNTGNHHRDLWFSVGTMHIVHTLMALPWPVIALALINKRSSKAACAGNDPSTLGQVFA
jgi:hypothetical protein